MKLYTIIFLLVFITNIINTQACERGELNNADSTVTNWNPFPDSLSGNTMHYAQVINDSIVVIKIKKKTDAVYKNVSYMPAFLGTAIRSIEITEKRNMLTAIIKLEQGIQDRSFIIRATKGGHPLFKTGFIRIMFDTWIDKPLDENQRTKIHLKQGNQIIWDMQDQEQREEDGGIVYRLHFKDTWNRQDVHYFTKCKKKIVEYQIETEQLSEYETSVTDNQTGKISYKIAMPCKYLIKGINEFGEVEKIYEIKHSSGGKFVQYFRAGKMSESVNIRIIKSKNNKTILSVVFKK